MLLKNPRNLMNRRAENDFWGGVDYRKKFSSSKVEIKKSRKYEKYGHKPQKGL